MFILNIFRYFGGYVHFTAEGDFVERLLNLLARNKIYIWNGHKTGNTYCGCVSIKDYKRIRKYAKITHTKVRIAEKTGVPFKRYRYRHRHGFAVGLALFALFLGIMSRFIWRIDISGLETISETHILQVLDSIGVRRGKLRSGIDVRLCEQKALVLLDDLSWIALNIEGSTIHVVVNESIKPPKMIDPNTPCNIIAKESGQITGMKVYDGQPMVSIGDSVVEGDLLVSGITQDRLSQNRFRHALADITAIVEHKIEFSMPLRQTVYKETGDTATRHFFKIAGVELPLFLPLPLEGPYSVVRDEKKLKLFLIDTGTGILSETYIILEEEEILLTEEEAREKAQLQLASIEKAELADSKILERSAKAKISGENFNVTAEYICEMNIALKKEIVLDSG